MASGSLRSAPWHRSSRIQFRCTTFSQRQFIDLCFLSWIYIRSSFIRSCLYFSCRKKNTRWIVAKIIRWIIKPICVTKSFSRNASPMQERVRWHAKRECTLWLWWQIMNVIRVIERHHKFGRAPLHFLVQQSCHPCMRNANRRLA